MDYSAISCLNNNRFDDFKKSNQKLADEMIIRAADADELIFEYGLNKAMNKYNA